MVIWKRGGRLLAEYQRHAWPPETMMPRLLERVTARVPGTAVFMVHRPAGVAALLVHYVSRIQTLHETVVLLTVETEPVPVLSAGPAARDRGPGPGGLERGGAARLHGGGQRPRPSAGGRARGRACRCGSRT